MTMGRIPPKIWGVACLAIGLFHGVVARSDCSLNGEFVGGKCQCDPAWEGVDCDRFRFLESPIDSGYNNKTYASWGGNVVLVNGTYHLFAAQFVEHCPLHNWGSNSEIIRAESSSPLGPFVFKQQIIAPFAHNPTIRQLPDGSYVIYMIGGTPSTPTNCSTPSIRGKEYLNSDGDIVSGIRISTSPTVFGPWSPPVAINFTTTNLGSLRGFTNPSPHIHPNGSVTLALQLQPANHSWEMIYVAKAETINGPYSLISAKPVFPDHFYCVAGAAEDPFLWQSPRGFHILVHGMCPSGLWQAHYAHSEDGINWTPSLHQTYSYTVHYSDKSRENFARVERPQLYFSSHNASTGTFSKPAVLYNGVCKEINCLFKATSLSHTLARPLGAG